MRVCLKRKGAMRSARELFWGGVQIGRQSAYSVYIWHIYTLCKSMFLLQESRLRDVDKVCVCVYMGDGGLCQTVESRCRIWPKTRALSYENPHGASEDVCAIERRIYIERERGTERRGVV